MIGKLLLTGTVAVGGWVITHPAEADQGKPPRPGWVACPAAGPVTSGWGPRWGTFHDGVDIGAPMRAPIYAVQAGTVVHSADDDPGGYGSYIEIRAADGTRIQYGHMSQRDVRTGQRVTAGQRIALVGAEGQATGPHLHLRVYLPGAHRGVDPVPWLAARGVRLPCKAG